MADTKTNGAARQAPEMTVQKIKSGYYRIESNGHAYNVVKISRPTNRWSRWSVMDVDTGEFDTTSTLDLAKHMITTEMGR